MMFSSHIDMTYKNSALQDMFVKLLLSSIGSPRRYMYPLHEKVMSDYIHTYIHKLYLSSDFSVAYIASISDPN